ncbi:acyl-CoA thioesterase [Crocinitomix catalasitica]|uniref:acyl-CoA thioesterase n=1 Tax=Crocinitomix catalasitica TaxID=184607 RepID=UPI00047FD7BA|nr:thioesterase family protein [Crocinitomix catalasitica]
MFSLETEIRVRYAETDQMGYVYYGNYATFFEVGRVETLRSIGFSYKSLEDQGIMLPVSNYTVKYLKPIFYDELITVKTTINKIPSVKIEFDYEIYNSKKELLSVANTVLVFVNKKTMKPCRGPEALIDKIKQF